MGRLARTLIVLAILGPARVAAHDVHSAARYVGNAGVLVTHGDLKVLFDAFYENSYDNYVLVPDAARTAMLEGQVPYDGVDAVVVSHIHGDHFTAEPALAYLRAQPTVRLYAPQQVVDALTARIGEDESSLRDRLVGFAMTPGAPAQTVEEEGLIVEAAAIPHSGGADMLHVHNLAFRVTLGDWPTVMHFGDAGSVDADFAPYQAFFQLRELDTAFPPYWFLLDEKGGAILDRYVRADQVIGIHVPARAVGQGDAWRAQIGADLFTDPGEVRSIDR